MSQRTTKSEFTTEAQIGDMDELLLKETGQVKLSTDDFRCIRNESECNFNFKCKKVLNFGLF